MRLVLALVTLFAALSAPASAAEWGAIIPGTSTMDTVRAQYGGPTRVDNQKTDGYDTASWVYEARQAPPGMKRMVVDFGLVSAGTFRREAVRSLQLEPHRGAFDRRTVLAGWGTPTRQGREADADVFFYREGLLVYFDKDGWTPRVMIFTPPQPPEAPAPK